MCAYQGVKMLAFRKNLRTYLLNKPQQKNDTRQKIRISSMYLEKFLLSLLKQE